LKKRLQVCNGFCEKKLALPVGDRRAKFHDSYMPQTLCVIDFENTQKCEAFRKCIAKTKKKAGGRLTF
jgi:hypothetical protein